MAPLDGSKLAECVLPHVEALARGCEIVDIVLIRVVTPAQHTVGDFVLPDAQVEKIDQENLESAEKYLQGVAGRVTVNGARVETKVLVGHDADARGLRGEKRRRLDRHRHPRPVGHPAVDVGQRRRQDVAFCVRARVDGARAGMCAGLLKTRRRGGWQPPARPCADSAFDGRRRAAAGEFPVDRRDDWCILQPNPERHSGGKTR